MERSIAYRVSIYLSIIYINTVQINSRNIHITIGHVVVYALVRVTARAIAGVLALTVPSHHRAFGHSHRVEHMEKYCKEIPEFDYRLKVKGGLTGYAQIYGKYNTSAYDKLRLDLMYIENYSIFLDIKLIIMTARILLSKESTEGFDVTKRNDEKLKKILRELHQEGKIETDE